MNGATDTCTRQDSGDDLIRLATTLAGSTRPEVVFAKTLATLTSAHPGFRWALIERVRSKRYRARGAWANAELRLLLDRAVGLGAWLCTDRTGEDDAAGTTPVHLQWEVARSATAPRDVQLVLGVLRGRGQHPLNQETLGKAASLIAGHLKAARLLDELLEKSKRDPLTRVLNRRGVLDVLKQETARAGRYGHPLSILFMDLDRFKEINDRQGHEIGDEVLVGVCRILSESLRSIDVVGRLGGDEFVIVLPDTRAECAKQIGRRLARTLADTPVRTSAGPIDARASVGVSSLDEDPSGRTLLMRADLRMLGRKRLAVRPRKAKAEGLALQPEVA